MSRRLLLLLFVLMAGMAACKPTADDGPQTAVPLNTEHRPLNTATATPTPIPELPHPSEFDDAFARGLIRYDPESGQWLVSAVQTVDGGRETVELALLPDSFATHDDLRQHNPFAPYTVRALDQNGQELTLLWNPDTAEFRVVPNFQELYTGVNTDNPQLNEEALDNLPTLTIEDVQSGDATRFILSYILERMDKGESLADILHMDPDAVRQNWQNLGGNSLLFELRQDGRVALLKAKGNDQSAQEFRYDNATMKVLPFAVNIEINGQNYTAFYIANFDPIDPSNPDPNNLANWKFFLSIPAYAGNPVDVRDPIVNWNDAFRQQAPIFPLAILYADETFQQNHPFIRRLLSIPGNDASRMEYTDNNVFALAHNINGRIAQINSENPIFETQSLSRPLPPELQLMIFLFEVGVAP